MAIAERVELLWEVSSFETCGVVLAFGVTVEPQS